MPLVKVGWFTVINDILQVRGILSKKSSTTTTGSNPTKVSQLEHSFSCPILHCKAESCKTILQRLSQHFSEKL